MPTIVVTSEEPGAGKTGVAAVIARHFAYGGTPTRLIRAGSDERAALDAAYFASLDFVPGSPATPGEPAAAASGECVVVEAEAGKAPDLQGATVVTVGRTDAGISIAVGGGEGHSIPLDDVLAGFDLDDVQRILSAEVLVEGDSHAREVTCDHLVIAPIGSDAGEPYFQRFETFACVVRFDRTDMHLAAIKGDATFLVLTGGRRPMDYLFDVANAEGVPVLLSLNDTENTVIALEAVFDNTRFHGERKLERMAALLAESGALDALQATAAPA